MFAPPPQPQSSTLASGATFKKRSPHHATGLCPSRGEARRLVQQGGIVVDEKKVESIDESIPQEKFAGDGVIIRKGKKVFHKAVTR